MDVVSGRRFALLFLLAIFVIIWYTIRKAKAGNPAKMRLFPAIEAIEEGVGRCAEMGRPVFGGPGLGQIETQWAAETMSGLSVLHYTSRFAARTGIDVISLVVRMPVIPLAEDAVRTAYMIEGVPERYRDDMVRFVPYGMAYDMTVMGVAERERPACGVIIGTYWHPALFTIEALNSVGAIVIGGTSRTVMTPFFIGGCDYSLLGEEVLAAGAYCSEDPVPKGSFEGQDYAKILSAVIIAIGVITRALGLQTIVNLLGW